MIINISNRQDKVSPAIRAKIESWLTHNQAHNDIISSVQVTLDKQGRQDRAEAILHAAGQEIVAHADGKNLYAALDALAAKIDRQLSKVRARQTHRKGTAKHSRLLSDAVNDAHYEEALAHS